MENRALGIIAMTAALGAVMDSPRRSGVTHRKPKQASLTPKVWKKKKANKRAQNQARNRQH